MIVSISYQTQLIFLSKTCSLEFFQIENGLEGPFRHLAMLPEEEEIVKKQLTEDILLYGSRSDPSDAVEVDERTQLASLPPKRSSAEFDAAVNRPAKIRRKRESREFNFRQVTAMDWNSGATPLEAWLNQSAVPSVIHLPETQDNQYESPSGNLAKEREEMQVFRTVHIEATEEPESNGTARDPPIDHTTLEPRTQIYLRNILDRYPLLPSYLALRLARANCTRAQRLDLKRHKSGNQPTSESVQLSEHNRQSSRERRTSTNDLVQSPNQVSRAQDEMTPGVLTSKTGKPGPYVCATCTRCFSSQAYFKRHERSHFKVKPFRCSHCGRRFWRSVALSRHLRVSHPRDGSSNIIELSPSEPTLRRQPSTRKTYKVYNRSGHQVEDSLYSRGQLSHSRTNTGFWTGGASTPRAASIHSQSSERNSSLHGSGHPGIEDQEPCFPDHRSRRSSASLSGSSAVLPPPPVHIWRGTYSPAGGVTDSTDQVMKPLRFFCDICEEEIEVLRRRDWQ